MTELPFVGELVFSTAKTATSEKYVNIGKYWALLLQNALFFIQKCN